MLASQPQVPLVQPLTLPRPTQSSYPSTVGHPSDPPPPSSTYLPLTQAYSGQPFVVPRHGVGLGLGLGLGTGGYEFDTRGLEYVRRRDSGAGLGSNISFNNGNSNGINNHVNGGGYDNINIGNSDNNNNNNNILAGSGISREGKEGIPMKRVLLPSPMESINKQYIAYNSLGYTSRREIQLRSPDGNNIRLLAGSAGGIGGDYYSPVMSGGYPQPQLRLQQQMVVGQDYMNGSSAGMVGMVVSPTAGGVGVEMGQGRGGGGSARHKEFEVYEDGNYEEGLGDGNGNGSGNKVGDGNEDGKGGVRRIKEIGKRRHVCGVCEKRFNRPSSLSTHMSVHTGAKPYFCRLCTRRFSVSSNLRRHERKTHTNKANSDRVSLTTDRIVYYPDMSYLPSATHHIDAQNSPFPPDQNQNAPRQTPIQPNYPSTQYLNNEYPYNYPYRPLPIPMENVVMEEDDPRTPVMSATSGQHDEVGAGGVNTGRSGTILLTPGSGIIPNWTYTPQSQNGGVVSRNRKYGVEGELEGGHLDEERERYDGDSNQVGCEVGVVRGGEEIGRRRPGFTFHQTQDHESSYSTLPPIPAFQSLQILQSPLRSTHTDPTTATATTTSTININSNSDPRGDANISPNLISDSASIYSPFRSERVRDVEPRTPDLGRNVPSARALTISQSV